MSASRSTPAPALAPARLMLILPAGLPAETMAAVAEAGDVAAVILRPTPDSPSPRPDAVARLQAIGAAVLLAGPAEAAGRAGLDGVHVDAAADLAATLRVLKPDAIVGAGGLTSRHGAMEAGEAGADYVLFGSLDADPADAGRVEDLVAWWAALFEVPCVGVAASLEEAGALGEAGADFVCLAAPLSSDPEAVREAQRRIASAAPADGTRP